MTARSSLPFTDPDHPQVVRNPAGPLTVKTQVCVIGSGAGGATFAAELAERGLEVVLLEKGPYVTRKQMTQRERDMLPLLYEDAGARTTHDGGILVLHAHCVGGTTVVNNAICFDPPSWLLDEWAEQHHVEGARRPDLEDAIAKVKFVLDVQKIQISEINKNGLVMQRGAQELGLGGDTFHHNRTDCLHSGFCMLGCAYDRKQNHHITYVPRALSFGARLYPDARVDRLLSRGDRITEAVGTIKNHETARELALSVKADVFVLAGGAISSPALLLASGLGNDQVGRNFHCHPIAAVVADMGDETVRGYEGIPQCYYVDRFLRDPGFLLESIFAGPSVSASLVPLWGSDLRRFMHGFENMASAYVQLRDEDSGRIRLDGRGVAIVDYTLSARDARKSQQGLEVLARLFIAAGARAVQLPFDGPPLRSQAEIDRLKVDFAPCQVSLVSAHQMGSLRMGEDSRTAAVDSRGKLHGAQNLYVADAAVFPTALGINPQITVAALATHFAQLLAAAGPLAG